jgi:hypothetical protein
MFTKTGLHMLLRKNPNVKLISLGVGDTTHPIPGIIA